LFEYLNCFCWHDLKNKFYQNTTKRCGKDGNNLFKRHGLFKFPVDRAGEFVVEQNADRLAALKRQLYKHMLTNSRCRVKTWNWKIKNTWRRVRICTTMSLPLLRKVGNVGKVKDVYDDIIAAVRRAVASRERKTQFSPWLCCVTNGCIVIEDQWNRNRG